MVFHTFLLLLHRWTDLENEYQTSLGIALVDLNLSDYFLASLQRTVSAAFHSRSVWIFCSFAISAHSDCPSCRFAQTISDHSGCPTCRSAQTRTMKQGYSGSVGRFALLSSFVLARSTRPFYVANRARLVWASFYVANRAPVGVGISRSVCRSAQTRTMK